MQTTISKWGNSLGVRIPATLTKAAGLTEGAQVDLQFIDGQITLKRKRKKYTLKELVDQITPDNIPEFIDDGPPVGAERFWENE